MTTHFERCQLFEPTFPYESEQSWSYLSTWSNRIPYGITPIFEPLIFVCRKTSMGDKQAMVWGIYPM
jgi:hypothetical protein